MFKVVLKSCGNPDFGQTAAQSPKKTIKVSSIKEASNACRDYISKYELGGGNWSGGQVYKDDKPFARISYNGRVWKANDASFSYSPNTIEILVG